MDVRKQTKTNRAFGITAGKARREASANRQEASQNRRAEVFRQDVEHTGDDGDPIRSVAIARTAKLAVECWRLHTESPRRSQLNIAIELDTTQATVSRLLREIRENRRDPATGFKLT